MSRHLDISAYFASVFHMLFVQKKKMIKVKKISYIPTVNVFEHVTPNTHIFWPNLNDIFSLIQYTCVYIYVLVYLCLIYVIYFFVIIFIIFIIINHYNLIKSGTFPTNTPRVHHVEKTWKRSFPRRFNVEYTWYVCRVGV